MTEHPIAPAVVPPSIDCEAAVRRLWDYLDAELDEARSREVQAHLDGCRHCPQHFAFALALQQAIAAGARRRPPSAALRARVLAALRAEGFTGAPD